MSEDRNGVFMGNLREMEEEYGNTIAYIMGKIKEDRVKGEYSISDLLFELVVVTVAEVIQNRSDGRIYIPITAARNSDAYLAGLKRIIVDLVNEHLDKHGK